MCFRCSKDRPIETDKQHGDNLLPLHLISLRLEEEKAQFGLISCPSLLFLL